jgi:hypothetical protein
MDEGMAKSQDEVLELYQAVGGKPRKEQANER